ncbi:hypothetical protein L2E82_10219 [Cichorium intybus]|uniref:Uncharacterized protein n=1 Tax=Cichorium intybus TaxID=13427 RepID=A0ACB9G9U9_CICIN|nr:hypothetical protein L2E82_10219 [Cichorium intybus]
MNHSYNESYHPQMKVMINMASTSNVEVEADINGLDESDDDSYEPFLDDLDKHKLQRDATESQFLVSQFDDGVPATQDEDEHEAVSETRLDYELPVLFSKEDENDFLDEHDHVVDVPVYSTKPRKPSERILKNKPRN